MTSTLILLNPHAGNGRLAREWPRLGPALKERFADHRIVRSENADGVFEVVDAAYQDGIRQILVVGGDGSNYVLVNALAAMYSRYPERDRITVGTLPMGTGRDWARGRGIPLRPIEAVEWLAQASPQQVDSGRLEIDDDPALSRHFLNIASVGLGGDVDARINRAPRKRPWTYLKSTVESVLTYQPPRMKLVLDGEEWFDQRLMLVVVANGTIFGHGMRVAPEAQVDDGLFDVIVVENMSRLRILRKLWHVYNATHLTEHGVHFRRAQTVEISCQDGPLDVDLDGEYAVGQRLRFTVQTGLLQMLLKSRTIPEEPGYSGE